MRRIISGIPDAVWLWLQYARDQELADSASLNLSGRVRQLFKNAGVGGSSRCLRFSFGDHFYALTGDVCQVASVMGQQPIVIRKRWVCPSIGGSEAGAYFSVTPSRLLE